METPVLVALLLAVVVTFFGWQWWSASSRRGSRVGAKRPLAPTTATPLEKPLAPVVTAPAAVATPPKEEKYPEVVGQTEAEMRTKEPLQRQPPVGVPRPQPVTEDGKGPAAVEDNLRHPEQMFYQPGPKPGPASDVAAGRAATVSTPGFASMGPDAPPMGAHQQGFVPEMAQNGGALFSGSVFAYDGMEPVGFAAF